MTGFGDRLRAARKHCGLTLEALAEKVGSTKAYMWQMENKDSASPSGDLLMRLCEALSVSPAALLGQESVQGVEALEKEVLFRKYGSLNTRDRQVILDLMQTMGRRDEISGSRE